MLPILKIILAEPTAWTVDVNYLWGLIVILILVVSGGLALMSKLKVQTTETLKELGDSQDKLLKTRNVEIADCEKENEELKRDVARVTGEYKTVVAILIDGLAKHWAGKEEMETEMENLKEENRKLKRRLEER
jgi:hypothetical protein